MNVLIDQYKRISAGSRHVLIREKNNNVIAKGNNKNGQCNVDVCFYNLGFIVINSISYI